MRVLLRIPDEYKGVARSIRRKAKRYGVKVTFVPDSLVYSDLKNKKDGCAGFFYETGTGLKELAVAIGNSFDRWMPIFLHESCHLDQRFDKSISAEKQLEWYNCCAAFFEWLDSIRQYNNKQLDKITASMIELERDCDIRTIQKIRDWRLPINIEEYIQRSNAYLYSYLIVKERRKWYSQIYSYKEVWESAPKTFFNDYSKVPIKLRRAIEKQMRIMDKELVGNS